MRCLRAQFMVEQLAAFLWRQRPDELDFICLRIAAILPEDTPDAALVKRLVGPSGGQAVTSVRRLANGLSSAHELESGCCGLPSAICSRQCRRQHEQLSLLHKRA